MRKELVDLAIKQFGLTPEQAREYVMERMYHGMKHEEAMVAAINSPWAKEDK